MKWACAWCNPDDHDKDTTHGICDVHFFAQIFLIGLVREQKERDKTYETQNQLPTLRRTSGN